MDDPRRDRERGQYRDCMVHLTCCHDELECATLTITPFAVAATRLPIAPPPRPPQQLAPSQLLPPSLPFLSFPSSSRSSRLPEPTHTYQSVPAHRSHPVPLPFASYHRSFPPRLTDAGSQRPNDSPTRAHDPTSRRSHDPCCPLPLFWRTSNTDNTDTQCPLRTQRTGPLPRLPSPRSLTRTRVSG